MIPLILVPAITVALVFGFLLHDAHQQIRAAERTTSSTLAAVNRANYRARMLQLVLDAQSESIVCSGDTICTLQADLARTQLELDNARLTVAVVSTPPGAERMALLGRNVIPMRSVR